MRYRINRFLAATGLASRRKCEEYIVSGRVSVNGTIVTNLSTYIDTQTDQVSVDGIEMSACDQFTYLALNKPTGFICTQSDPLNRPRALDLVTIPERVFSIGRLDVDTSGLLLFTNHGALAHRLAHPKYIIPKEYHVLLKNPLSQEKETELRETGVTLEDGPIKPLALIKKSTREYLVTISEGRNRIVRRMFAHQGSPVVGLERIRFGSIHLNGLKSGKTRPLASQEISELIKSVGL